MEKPNMAPVTMETPWRVRFRNVGQAYFPQTRVECCYTISSKHSWNNRDWIGLFKVGWGSVKEYYTFAWALAPDGYVAGTDMNCSVVYQPSYLPSPGGTAFQFVYVDGMDQICGVSPHFTFSAPRPLDELVTLEEEMNGEDDNGDDLLLVVPKAQILQSHLEACQEELKQAQKKFEAAAEKVEEQRKRNESERNSFEEERTKMRDEIEDLSRSLRSSMEKMERMEEKQKDVVTCHEKISAEMKGLLAERTEHHQRIKELEDDLSNLTLQKQETEVELDRMKERVKKLTTQRKDEEDEKRNLQLESKQAQEELRVLQERVEASERSTEALRRDLSELGALQGHSHAELHQVRLQAAQMTLQLSQAHLALREGQASWAQERESMRQGSEVEKDRIQKLSRELQKKEEWLQEERTERERLEAELGSQKDCNRELRASLRAIQKEREQHQLERQELLDHIRVLQLRIERDTGALWTEAASTPLNIDSVPSVTERSSLEKANEIQLLPQRKEEEEEEANQGEAALASLPEPTGNHKKETDREEMKAVDLSGESALDTGIENQLHLSEVERNKSSELSASPLW